MFSQFFWGGELIQCQFVPIPLTPTEPTDKWVFTESEPVVLLINIFVTTGKVIFSLTCFRKFVPKSVVPYYSFTICTYLCIESDELLVQVKGNNFI